MSRFEAIGILVIIWHDSQERGVWKGPRDRIERFIPVNRASRPEIFNALVEHEYVSLCPDGEYVIHGNRKHIEAIEEKKHAGSEGGRKSGKVRSGQIPNKNADDEALASTAEADASSAEPNTIQCSSIHSSSTQGNTKQSNTEKRSFDLESAYRRYPRKEGKSKGLKKLRGEIKTAEDFERLIVAIENYAVSRRHQEAQFTKHFSTFASEWRDWIDYKPSDSPANTPTPNNPAYRRMAGNQHALNEALKMIGEGDEQAS